MSATPDHLAHTPSVVEIDSIFDALVGWGEIERAFDLSRSQRRWVSYGFGSKSLQGDERMLLRAMRHPRPRIRIVAAELGQDWPSVMAMALRDPHWRVRATGAASTMAPPELLADLACESSTELRYRAARNAALPEPALLTLLDDPERSVREAAAGHPHLPAAEILRLADHPEKNIRCIVARRSLPAEVLDRLARDPELSVAEAVARNPAALPDTLHFISRRTRSGSTLETVIKHPNTRPDDVLWCVANMTDSYETRRLAEKTARADFMILLARSATEGVRSALLKNPALTPDAMALFPLEASIAEHRETVYHPRATWETCRRLAAHYLTSRHYGRRNIGLEFVAEGLNCPGVPTDVPAHIIDGSADRADLLRYLSECG